MNSVKAAFWSGVRQFMPFNIVVIPFALLFGVVATEAGLSVFETLSFSVVVIAGAAQFTALQLMAEHSPTIIVLASALAVNLRMAMYSATLAPYLGKAPLWKRAFVAYFLVDQVFALSSMEYEKRPEWTVSERLAFAFGVATPMAPVWYIATFFGAYLGNAIPDGMALDFAVPITFLAMIGPALRTLAHVGAAATALIVSPLLVWMPHSLNIMLAGIAAMIVGAAIENRMNRRAV